MKKDKINKIFSILFFVWLGAMLMLVVIFVLDTYIDPCVIQEEVKTEQVKISEPDVFVDSDAIMDSLLNNIVNQKDTVCTQ